MADSNVRHRTDSSKNLVGFVVGDVHYAIDIARVREIVNPLDITPLPYTPAEVAGVSDHRGEVVPVIDLRIRFNLAPKAEARGTKWILVTLGKRVVGLIVDSVTEVFGAAGEEIRPTPEVGGDRDMRGINGVAKHDGKLVFILDIMRFLEIVDALSASGAI